MTASIVVRAGRIAGVIVPDFAVAVERMDAPDLAGRPVVIGGAPEEKKIVLACSVEARTEGIAVGVQLRSVLPRCPQAVVIEARHPRYEEVANAINLALATLSPWVEPVRPGETFVGLDGLISLHGSEEQLAAELHRATTEALGSPSPALAPVLVGAASGKFGARVAAMLADPLRPRVVAPDGLAPFLAKLPVRMLPVSADMQRRLRLFGVRTLGALVKLPLSAVQAQFGVEGRKAWELASGIDDEPLRPIEYAVEMTDKFTFEQPVITIDVILLVTRQLVERMVKSKGFGYRAARGLHFQAKMVNGQIWERDAAFREPMTDSRRMLLALLGKLNSFVPAAPIEELRITLTDLCAEGGTQARMAMSERVTHLEPLRDAIDQLRSRLGFNPIAKIVEVEPWSRIPERRLALMTYDL